MLRRRKDKRKKFPAGVPGQTSQTKMQGVSLFLVLLVTAASFSLDMSLPLQYPCFKNMRVLGLIQQGDSYFRTIPPCVDNVNKSKIFDYFTYYDNTE